MPINKARISPPVEAGQSLLDAKHLPAQLTTALEYVSNRLVRKRLDISLVVLRGDAQIPIPQSSQSPTSRLFLTSPSPSQSSSSPRSFRRSASTLSSSSSTSSTSSTASLSRTQWPSLPASPKATCSPQSPTATRPRTPSSPNPYGITLIHASTLTAKAEKVLSQAITKAEKKFSIGSGWLSSQPMPPSTDSLIHRSLIQNEVLFSSEGLTLLAVDHVYTFKSQLHTYSRTLSTADLALAVDELRRLVLAQHGRQITKAYLMRAYTWLGVSIAALVDVNEGYKVAYGGPEKLGGIELQSREGRLPTLVKSFGLKEAKSLRLQTSFDDCSSTKFSGSGRMAGYGLAGLKEDKGPYLRGPSTPNHGAEVTPITRGEWSSLMADSGWAAAKIAAVESC